MHMKPVGKFKLNCIYCRRRNPPICLFITSVLFHIACFPPSSPRQTFKRAYIKNDYFLIIFFLLAPLLRLGLEQILCQ